MNSSLKESCLSLADTSLKSRRSVRYDGGGFGLPLDSFAAEDLSAIQYIYDLTKQLYDLWLYMQDSPNYPLLVEQVKRLGESSFFERVGNLHVSTFQRFEARGEEIPMAIRKALHDIRGGALSALSGYGCLFLEQGTSSTDTAVKKAVSLARDHAKMMRNLLPEIDPLVRAADESTRLHLIDSFVSKWRDFTFFLDGREVMVKASSDVRDGWLTSRCLETSAVDRILYNLVNNAARFAASERVVLSIFKVNDEMLRWVVCNEITETQEEWLDEQCQGDLSLLFSGGYTRGGSGIGLSNCVDLVAESCGLKATLALQKGYLGARVEEHKYFAWFHWPLYVPQAGDERCHCSV